MANPLEGQFRILVLIVATWGVSMMFSNVLTLPATLVCMSEGKYRWEDFSIDLGTDVFNRVNFDPPQPPTEAPEVPETSYWPDFDIPGIRVPTPGFNWQSLRLARQHPDLFLRLLQKVAKEVGIRAARRLGQALDPRDIDFRKLMDGFNLTDYDPNVVFKVKDYVIERIKSLQRAADVINTSGQKLSRWDNVTVNDVELKNITWNGVIHGRVRIQEKAPDVVLSRSEKAWLLASPGIGALMTIGPFSRSVEKFGCRQVAGHVVQWSAFRKTFTVVAIISAVGTFLIPLLASLGFWPILVCRILQGVGFAACFPVIGAVTTAWATLTENGLFNGALTSFIQIGPFITMPLSALLCQLICWSLSYYVHAALTLIFVVVWWVTYRDTPAASEPVSLSELRQIQNGKVTDFRLKYSKVPVKAIYHDYGVWAVWIAALGKSFVIILLISFLPYYFFKVLNYSTLASGLLVAVPVFLQMVVKLGTGILSDHVQQHNETTKVKLFNSVGFFPAALLLILLGLVGAEDMPAVAVVLIILTITVLGVDVAGFFKSSTVIGRHYAYYINLHVQAIFCLAVLLTPFIAFPLTPDDRHAQWTLVFSLLAIFLVASGIFFLLKGSGEAAAFTQTPKLTEQEQLKTVEAEK